MKRERQIALDACARSLEECNFGTARYWLRRLHEIDAEGARTELEQPVGARSLDLDLRFLGTVIIVPHHTRCAVCSRLVEAGARGIQSSSTQAISHRACGEVLRPGGGP